MMEQKKTQDILKEFILRLERVINDEFIHNGKLLKDYLLTPKQSTLGSVDFQGFFKR